MGDLGIKFDADQDEFGKKYNDPEEQNYEEKRGPLDKLLISMGMAKSRKQAEFVLIGVAVVAFLLGIIFLII
jgi:hypothetical protein